MLTRFIHYRVVKGKDELSRWFKPFRDEIGNRVHPGYIPDERGGLTICVIKKDDKVISWGLAECSKKDSFCYATGRNLSYERALAWLNGEVVPYNISEHSLCRPIFDLMQHSIRMLDGAKL